MNVLYIIPGLGVGGGTERSLLDLASGLAAAGIDLRIAYFHERPTSAVAAFRALGVPVERIEATSFAGKVLGLRRLLRRERPDVLHTTLFEADLVGRIAAVGTGTVVLSSLVNMAYEDARRQDPTYSRWRVEVVRRAESVTLRHLTHHVHANSNAVARSAVLRLGVPQDRITMVHRGRDPQALRPIEPARRQEVRAALGVAEHQRLVLAVGRHEYMKGHLTLIDALPAVVRAHPEVVVALAGRAGGMTGHLRAALQWTGMEDHVLVLGHRSDVSDLLASADIFAFPSIHEGLPGAVIEAMAMEVPIVASAIDPVCELVDERSASLVAPSDPEALAAALIDVLERPEAARARCDAARARFLDEFTVARALEGMTDLYRSVVGR